MRNLAPSRSHVTAAQPGRRSSRPDLGHARLRRAQLVSEAVVAEYISDITADRRSGYARRAERHW